MYTLITHSLTHSRLTARTHFFHDNESIESMSDELKRRLIADINAAASSSSSTSELCRVLGLSFSCTG